MESIVSFLRRAEQALLEEHHEVVKLIFWLLLIVLFILPEGPFRPFVFLAMIPFVLLMTMKVWQEASDFDSWIPTETSD